MMLGIRDEFRYGECEGCGSLVLLDPPDDLSPYYPASYYAHEPPTRRAAPVRALRRLRGIAALRGHERLAAALGGGKPPHWIPWMQVAGLGRKAAICDIGCGSGELLADLASAGVRQAVGADPMVTATTTKEGARIERMTAAELAASPGQAGAYDLVMFNHSFEHLREPTADLAGARELLAPGGTLMLRTPLLGGWAWRHYGSDWVGLDAPRHLFVPSLAGIAAALGPLGLEIREVLYDSTEMQFWRSEQYRNNVALFEPGSHQLEPDRSPFSRKQIDRWRLQAERLNRVRDGDTAAIFIAEKPSAGAPRAGGVGWGADRPLRVGVAAMDPRTPGGVTTLVEAWQAAGLGRNGGPVELVLIPTSAMGSSIPVKALQMLKATVRTAALLASRRLDVVHLNASTGSSLRRKLLLARLCRLAGVPYIAHLHSGSFDAWLQDSGRNRRLARALVAPSAATIVLARRWAGTVRQLGAVRTEVLANGIPAAERRQLERVARARADERTGSRPAVLLFYGRWSEIKGLDVLAQALVELRDSTEQDFELRVFGNGDRVWAETVLKPLRGRARLGGWLEGAAKLAELRGADLFVAPSRHEGMPVALIEARAAGLPIVATDVGAVADVIGDIADTALVPPGDADALARALANALEHRGSPKPSRADPRAVLEPTALPEQFRAEVSVARLEAIYADAVRRAR